MADTDHYHLQRLTTDDLSPNSFKFSDSDRVLIDTLLYLGAEGHHHTGGAGGTTGPTTAPVLTLDTTTGNIPANTRVYYKYTYVDGAGVETSASLEAYVDTPAATSAPAKPSLVTATTGGTLPPGNYFYVLTAYESFNTRETTADNAAYISVAYTTSTNKITLTLPVLPAGATGFNVYRKGPSNIGYRYLTSVNMSVATPPTTFVDDGSLTEDPDRPTPAVNSTQTHSQVTVAIPGATPTLPFGYSWKIYRTYVTGDYTNSYLAITTALTYVDSGTGTTVGEPPSTGTSVGSPSKVNLTGAAEVQGVLPTANIANFTQSTQDIAGAMATDTATIDFTYGSGVLTAIVKSASLTTSHMASGTLAAANITYAGNLDLQSTNVEAALDELDNEKLSRFGGVRHGMNTAGNAGSAATIDLSLGNVVRYTLNSATVTFTFPTVTGVQSGATPTVFAHEFWLILTQDGSGSRLVSWPTKVKWTGRLSATPFTPTLSTGAGSVDIFRFMSPDLGTTWYGVAWGLGF